jgi:hypothetical protein
MASAGRGLHAAHDLFGGYCYLNNAAIAAHWLSSARRSVAILDVDVHHGNGRAIFWERPDVLYVSLHSDPRGMYPYYVGYPDEVGCGAGIDPQPAAAAGHGRCGLPRGARGRPRPHRGLRCLDARVSLGVDT